MVYIFLLILLILSALFSGMEIALFSLTPAQVKSFSLRKKPNAAILHRLLKNKNRLLVVLLLGNNLVNITAASLATVTAIKIFGDIGAGIATGVMTFLILIFGEMYPKAYFHLNAEKIALFFAPFIYVLQLILWPIVLILEKLLLILTGNLSGKKTKKRVSEIEFKALSRLAVEEGMLDFEEHEMIMNVLEFNDVEVREIMTPRYKMEIINDDVEIDQVAYFLAQTGHSRYPVYHNDKDNIIGYIHVMDILKALNSSQREESVVKLIKPILEVNPYEKINTVFNKMRRKKAHIALIIRKDELLGMVTMEDILEHLVGNIEDENDE